MNGTGRGLGTPVGPRGLRDICDDKDDGHRNWFVTLAYRDLALLTAQYTHGKPVPGVSIPVSPSGDRVSSEAPHDGGRPQAPPDVDFGPTLTEADRLVNTVTKNRRAVTAVQSTVRPGTVERLTAAGPSPADIVARMAGLKRKSMSEARHRTQQTTGPKHPLNANFCTFATWSSLTLGRDIRNDRLPRRLDRIGGLRLRHYATNLVIDARKTNNMELSRLLGLGQRVVLWEVGTGLYAMFLGQEVLDRIDSVRNLDFLKFKGQRNFTDEATSDLAKVIEGWLTSTVTPRGAGGLTQLRTKDLALGLASYHLARCAALQGGSRQRLHKWVAELILRGNLLIGAYEQRKVDQLLKFPIDDFASDFFLQQSGIDAMEQSGEGRWRRRLVFHAQRHLTQVPEVWGRFFTDQIMVLWAGDELLRLGRDLPIPPGATTFFPDDLETIQDDWLKMLLLRYDHSYGNGHGTQSRIWSIFDDRMNYIVNFMRSRAQTPGLWQDPFEPEETRSLRMHNLPKSSRSRDDRIS